MTLLGYTFEIGTSNGKYPAGTTVTDTLLKFGNVLSVTKGAQTYNTGFTIIDGTLDHSEIFTTVNGDNVTINFQNLLIITKSATV